MTSEQLQKMSRSDLIELAKAHNIKNRSSMRKQQLIESIIQSSTDIPKAEAVSPDETVEWTVQNPISPSEEITTMTQTHSEREIPFSYNQTRVILLVRDPYWLYCYWDFSSETHQELMGLFHDWNKVPLTLRVFNVGDALSGYDTKLFDVPLNANTKNWYLNVNGPGQSYRVDLGYIHPYEGFVLLAQSNIVSTPRDSISDIVDEEWMIIEEDFRRLYRLAGWGRPGSNSAELVESLIKRLEREMGSAAVSSISSPVKIPAKDRGFWLVLDTELILYGRTEPDAQLTIGGQPVTLRPDGSFTLRMALPDGQFPLPVVATSSAGDETISITPVVQRNTHYSRVKEER